MGNLCAFCYKQSASCETLTPDLETRRRQQKEAAERRIAEQERRGIKNMDAVRHQQRLDEQRERHEQEAATYNAQAQLKWQVN